MGAYQGNELTRNSSGNTRPQSFWLAEPLWTDPGLKIGIGVRELISTLNKKFKKNADGGKNDLPPKKILACEEKTIIIIPMLHNAQGLLEPLKDRGHSM